MFQVTFNSQSDKGYPSDRDDDSDEHQDQDSLRELFQPYNDSVDELALESDRDSAIGLPRVSQRQKLLALSKTGVSAPPMPERSLSEGSEVHDSEDEEHEDESGDDDVDEPKKSRRRPRLKTKGDIPSRRTPELSAATTASKRKRGGEEVAGPAKKKSKAKTTYDHIQGHPKATKADIPTFIVLCNDNVGSHGCAPNGLLNAHWPDDVNAFGRILADSVFGGIDPAKIKGWGPVQVARLFQKPHDKKNKTPGLNANGDVALRSGQAANKPQDRLGRYCGGQAVLSDDSDEEPKKGKMRQSEREKYQAKFDKMEKNAHSLREQCSKQVREEKKKRKDMKDKLDKLESSHQSLETNFNGLMGDLKRIIQLTTETIDDELAKAVKSLVHKFETGGGNCEVAAAASVKVEGTD